MYVIEVVPLGRNTILETLSYFSTTAHESGVCVQVPIRGRNVPAVVTKVSSVSSAKTTLRAATFSLRKLPEQQTTTTIPGHLLTLISEMQKIYPLTTGAFLHALIPNEIRTGEIPFPASSVPLSHEDSTPTVLSVPRVERFITYQSIVRSAFAHRGSVLLVVPHAATAHQLYHALKTGIEDRVVCFTPHQTKRERNNAYAVFTNYSHTTLTITTPSHAYLDRPDMTHIIIEEAGSASYQTTHRPLFDHREILKKLAVVTQRVCILGDTVTRTEDEGQRRKDIYTTYSEHPKRLQLSATLTIIEQTDTPTPEKPFALFSSELIRRITTTLDGRKNVFLYAARRGLAPVVYCLDCGHIFRCPDSGAPYSLLRTHHHDRGEERWFVASTSGKRVRAADVCPHCNSWRLRERGIGIQHIQDEIKTVFPHAPVTVIDSQTASTHKKATDLVRTAIADKGHILLGTTMTLPYLAEHIHISAIISLDAVRSIPTWRADEALFRLLIALREKTEQEVIIQTRTQSDDLLDHAARGAVEHFHDDELALRKMAYYPPYVQFIFLTWQGTPEAIAPVDTTIGTLLTTHNITTYEFYSNPRSLPNRIIRHCLIRVPSLAPHQAFITELRSLPPYISVAINPDRIV